MKRVTILQIDIESIGGYFKKFTSLRMLEQMGLEIDIKDYEKVYEGDMDVENPEDVYKKLQGKKPEGYKGHSLSVSDIVLMDGKAYFCDDYGFKDITSNI